MSRFLTLAYGLVAYVLFLGAFLYLLAFLANLPVGPTVDHGPATAWPLALAINVGLLALFGLQHSVMARPTFKQWWTRFVPQPIERSTYVLATNLALAVLYWQWRPLDAVVWDLSGTVGGYLMWGLFAAGWLAVLATTLLINHFDLFGLRQVWLYFRRRPYTSLGFVTPGPYRFIRHPLYVGWMAAFWATPTMTLGHSLFAAGLSGYILIAIYFEERNLVQFHAEYGEYRRRVPRFVPRLRWQASREAGAVQVARETVHARN